MKVKAILVAGGQGTRLLPFTNYTQKTLLPLNDRPVIDYALGTIRRAGISNITIIANQFIGQIAKHVGSGLEKEVVHYVMEDQPKGVLEALKLAKPHNENCRLLVYFSDNITTIEMNEMVSAFERSENPPGCVLLAREVENASQFGVAILNQHGELKEIVEKPEIPLSNVAIGGIYMFDETFWEKLELFSQAEKFSISDVNNLYINEGKAKILNIGDDTWIDCGTPQSLLQASIMAFEGKLDPNPHRE